MFGSLLERLRRKPMTPVTKRNRRDAIEAASINPTWSEEDKAANDILNETDEKYAERCQDILDELAADREEGKEDAVDAYFEVKDEPMEMEVIPGWAVESEDEKVGCYDIYETHIFLDNEFRLEDPDHLHIIRELFSFQNIYHDAALYGVRSLVEIRGRRQLVTYFRREYPANRTALAVKDYPGISAYNIKKIAYDN